MTFEEIKEKLQSRCLAKSLSREDIPRLKGIYVWSSVNAKEVLYVGKAEGKKYGLRGRIWTQHLNPKYLESRVKIFQPEDDFQLGCKVMVKGKLCVDKSVFRRSIGRSLRLVPGEETVRYIRDNLMIAWVTFPSDQAGEIRHFEAKLIKELKPRMNVQGIS